MLISPWPQRKYGDEQGSDTLCAGKQEAADSHPRDNEVRKAPQVHAVNQCPGPQQQNRAGQRGCGIHCAKTAVAQTQFGPDVGAEKGDEECLPQAGPERHGETEQQ